MFSKHVTGWGTMSQLNVDTVRGGPPRRDHRLKYQMAVVMLVLTAVVALLGFALVALASSGKGDLGFALPARMPQSDGRAYYVDGARGRDTWSGTKARPWRTINRALASVPLRGSRILVRAGTYGGEVRFIDRVGSPSDPVTLEAYPGEHVTLVAPPNSDRNAVTIVRAGGIRIQGFEVTGPTGNNGFRVENSRDVEILDCDIHNAGHMGVLVVGTGSTSPTGNDNIQLWDNRFHDNGGGWIATNSYWIRGDHSVYWGGVSSDHDGIDHTAYRGVIANNLFYNQPYGRALQIGSQVSGLIVTNNTFYRAYQPNPLAGTAIEFYGEGTQYDTRNTVVVNNLITYSAHYGVSGSGGDAVMRTNVVRNNLAFGNSSGDFRADTGDSELFSLGPDNIVGQPPRFVAPYRLDFRLQPSSPAIDRADPAFAPKTDADGRPRVGPPDLGAFESDARRTTSSKG